MRVISIVIIMLLSLEVSADKRIEPMPMELKKKNLIVDASATEGLELLSSQVRSARDGTGVITNVECKLCKSSVLKITNKTTAYLKGKKTDITKIGRQPDRKIVYVRFDIKTNEVIFIKW